LKALKTSPRRLDILVNNAGEQHEAGSLAEISGEQLRRTFSTNMLSMFHLTKARWARARAIQPRRLRARATPLSRSERAAAAARHAAARRRCRTSSPAPPLLTAPA